ncbi:demethylspheroidene O-methyltransferase [Hasllibacter halocynthiae]|uniref:Demethylspheroidene O-methyltransferase n=1 Tax=Hasllibacter halocynthiae TaxID=595589 RepID=A0A2T0X2W4_9RHOB|nr:methyltransferase [Hasllibacter halocynthiae]PRY93271.1 demethylspheroidene O-methyltransferase [Hasllibacter halocynthiae]
MTAVDAPLARRGGWRARVLRLAASPRFQSRGARSPLLRRRVRRDGEAIFDLVAGFVHSQALLALVELDLPGAAIDAPVGADHGAGAGIAPGRMATLLDAGAALGLLRREGEGWRATLRGAALSGVPGLRDMIRHHRALYADLADPLAILRGGTGELARFWPYVHGEAPEAEARRYSALMADSLGPVAEEVLDAVDLSGVRHLMDVGGGTGAFLCHAARRTDAALTLFDLPAVAPAAEARFRAEGVAARIAPGSFRDGPLPEGADCITLIRVLYDHDDATVAELLARCRTALPDGGRLIVAEPMRGSRAGDLYFAFYCMAMGTGRARTPDEVARLVAGAGFGTVRQRRTRRPFVTSVVEAHT